MEFSTAILEGLVVQEDDVRFWELFPCLLRNADVVVLMQRGTDQPNFVTVYDSHQLLAGL